MNGIWVGPGGARPVEAIRREWDREIPGGERVEAPSGAGTRQAPGTSLLQVPEDPLKRMNVIGL